MYSAGNRLLIFEIMPKPPVGRSKHTLQAHCTIKLHRYARGLRTKLAHQHKEFIANDKGELVSLKTVSSLENDRRKPTELVEKEGIEKIWPASCLVSTGLPGPEKHRPVRAILV
jgi:hypothetical protein